MSRVACRMMCVCSFVCLLGVAKPALAAPGSDEIKKLLADPPTQYSSAPLWVWTDELTEEKVLSSLRDLAAQNVKQVFVHPRPGLITPYLGDKWFALWRAVLAEAERLDMNVWIYDENSYPSGFAGGFVPDAMPESRSMGLSVQMRKEPGAWDKDTLGIYRIEGPKATRLKEGESEKPAEGAAYMAVRIERSGTTPWLAGKFYVDLLRRDVTEKFIEVTHEVYRRELGQHFGKRIPGIFTDEPNVGQFGGVPWTPALPVVFKERWGYDLLDHLPALQAEIGDFRKVRHDYWWVVNRLFIDNWAKPTHDWCEKHGMEWTGHYWEHEWPRAKMTPDNMAMYAWHHRPAIDTLFNMYDESVGAQFGNTRAVLELASVANQLGRKRTLCEAYGAGGWDLRFEDMKRIGDWLYVLGVNTFDQHIADISIRGARKHDHPQSFSYHEPWWEDYHVSARYFERLTAVMAQGDQVNDILLLEPTTTGWMYNDTSQNGAHLLDMGTRFQKLVHLLAVQQVEFDIGSETIIGDHGSVRDGSFVVGQRAYRCVVIPEMTESLEPATVKLLTQYVKQGGRVVCVGEPPAMVEARPSDEVKSLTNAASWKGVTPAEALDAIKTASPPGFAVKRGEDRGILFHHRRHIDDGQIVLLVNTSITNDATGTVDAVASGVEQWDLETGKPAAYAFVSAGDRVRAPFKLPPCGSLVLFLTKSKALEAAPLPVERADVVQCEPGAIRRIGPNVLTLDYVDVTVRGDTKRGMNVVAAANHVFKAHGFDTNPWDRGVQFKDELIRRTFDAGSGFTLTYRFTIEDKVPADLAFVAERADLYKVACNGKPVTLKQGDWWLDKSFGRIDVSREARVGENEVTLVASPMTIYHEVDNAYVLGDFGLKASEHGFAIVPAEAVKLGPWNVQGLPLYATGVSYTQECRINDANADYRVRLPHWYGSVARVIVNGQPAGHVAYAPWTCDISGKIKPGVNTIEVIVIGTLKNTLGPHHNNPQLGIAGPFSWDNAPAAQPSGEKYHTVGYGLMAPFVVERVTK